MLPGFACVFVLICRLGLIHTVLVVTVLSNDVEANTFSYAWSAWIADRPLHLGAREAVAISKPQETVMSATGSLHLSFDNANGQIQGLQAENRRMRVAHLEWAAEAECLASCNVPRVRTCTNEIFNPLFPWDFQNLQVLYACWNCWCSWIAGAVELLAQLNLALYLKHTDLYH